MDILGIVCRLRIDRCVQVAPWRVLLGAKAESSGMEGMGQRRGDGHPKGAMGTVSDGSQKRGWGMDVCGGQTIPNARLGLLSELL